MSKPRLLDMYCGAGGSAVGYHRAGFEVVGIDLEFQKHYPFEFHQADALTYPLEGFDAYHASPPCQAYSIMKNLPWVKSKNHPKLIDPTRERLVATGKPFVIENVMGAKLQAGWLCGQMFGLPFYRHRAFETNFPWMQPAHPNHTTVIEAGRMLGRMPEFCPQCGGQLFFQATQDTTGTTAPVKYYWCVCCGYMVYISFEARSEHKARWG